MIARIATPWVAAAPAGATPWLAANHPRLLDDHPLPAGGSYSDVTGQPAANLVPAPNLYTVEVAGVSQAWLDVVGADPTYAVLWSQ